MNKRWKVILTAIVLFFMMAGPAFALDVWEIHFRGEVSPSQARWLADAYDDAREAGAEAVYLLIDTPGGRLDSALQMAGTIKSKETIVLVDGGAISAGALLALAADEMYMAQGSTIGAAEPQIGGERADEKTVSFWSAELAAEAEKNGRDAQIARAMADDTIAIEGLVEEGRLLTLTAQEALENGMTDGVFRNAFEFEQEMNFNVLGSSGKTTRDLLADFLTSALISTLLLTIGIAGIMIEIFSPGFGFPGAIGLSALGLYFGGSVLAGISGWEAVLLFLVGLVLLLVEVFVLPGFGVAGIIGFIAIFGSVFIATPDPATAVQSVVIALVAAVVLVVVLFKFMPGRSLWSRLVLQMGETPDRGYVAAKAGLNEYLGKTGVAKSTLRPSGTADIDGRYVDVVTSGDFIAQGARVEVIDVEGMRVVVREIKEEMK